jgi:hypothetical protein
MLRYHKCLLSWSVLVLFLTGAGCDSGPKIVKVEGTLCYQGNPVTNAYIKFRPAYGRESWAETDEQGHFIAHYDAKRDGVVAGEHKLWVLLKPATVKEQEAVMMGKKAPLSKQMAAFFEKYGEQRSKVEVTIDKSTADLKLDWD